MLPERAARMVGQVLAEPLIVTLAALALTLPLIVLYFERMSLVVIPVNLLVVRYKVTCCLSGRRQC